MKKLLGVLLLLLPACGDDDDVVDPIFDAPLAMKDASVPDAPIQVFDAMTSPDAMVLAVGHNRCIITATGNAASGVGTVTRDMTDNIITETRFQLVNGFYDPTEGNNKGSYIFCGESTVLPGSQFADSALTFELFVSNFNIEDLTLPVTFSGPLQQGSVDIAAVYSFGLGAIPGSSGSYWGCEMVEFTLTTLESVPTVPPFAAGLLFTIHGHGTAHCSQAQAHAQGAVDITVTFP